MGCTLYHHLCRFDNGIDGDGGLFIRIRIDGYPALVNERSNVNEVLVVCGVM